MNTIIQRYEYHQWANNRFFEHLKTLPQEVYRQQVKSVFSSVSEVMEHVYQTDGMWLSVMSGDPFEKTMEIINHLQAQSADKNLEEIQVLYQELSDNYRDFMEEKKDLDKNITIEHPRFGQLVTPVAELLQHVVNHGTYHRGNITAMLRQLGYEGVPNDYVFYLYGIQEKG